MGFRVPDGFLPVLTYPGGKEPGVVVAGRCRLDKLEFFIGDPVQHVPLLPLKQTGKLWHTGWDLPTRWAIDANNQCWMNDAHGNCLELVSSDTLISTGETEDERNGIRHVLGLLPEEPGWMAQARAAGWAPR